MLKSQVLKINSKYFLTIIGHLRDGGGLVRLVGGVVRDALLGISAKDVDMATDLLPEEVMNVLQKAGIKTIPTGVKFGTVTAVIKDESFEITTLRRDLSCNGRHADVAYSKDFAEDAARRDFTINALSYCPINHQIYDYFNGIEDLESRRVIFIGNAKERIAEDYLRILRFFRFSCRYARHIDQDGLSACIELQYNLSQLSGERIKSEMDLLLLLNDNQSTLQIMQDSNILQQILPIQKYNSQMHTRFTQCAKSFDASLSLAVIYAMLFMHSNDISVKKLLNLKFSRAEANLICAILNLKNIKGISLIITKLKNIWLDDSLYMQYFIFIASITDDNLSIRDLYNRLGKLPIPKLPIDGNDLMELGFKDVEIGKNMDILRARWVESDFTLNKVELIKMVKQ